MSEKLTRWRNKLEEERSEKL